MARRPRKTFEQYLSESLDHDSGLAALYDETRLEGQLALDLANLRNERGMSQRALAAKSGIAQPVISRLERGAEVPTLATLVKLTKALQATVEVGPEGIKVQPIPLTPFEAYRTAVTLNLKGIWASVYPIGEMAAAGRFGNFKTEPMWVYIGGNVPQSESLLQRASSVVYGSGGWFAGNIAKAVTTTVEQSAQARSSGKPSDTPQQLEVVAS
jgi:transcriptional regulator with XRE-family HTH domain